jgi:serine/threonine protein kinase
MEKKQVIHRDIKPSNIMIDMNQLAGANEDDDGESGPAIFDVKLLDFGCAMRL